MNPLMVFKYATRSRPELFDRGINSIIDNLDDKEAYFILVTCDLSDRTMIDHDIKYADNLRIKFVYGLSEGKISAINIDLQYLPNDTKILVNMSDDMVFTKNGFDTIIRNDFNNDFSLCLHYPDGYRSDIITMSILGKDYFDRFGYIYNPSYKSLFCDDEQTAVAKLLNKYKYIDNQIFIHKHPANDSSVMVDSQYVHTESYFGEDRETFNLRKSNNFYL